MQIQSILFPLQKIFTKKNSILKGMKLKTHLFSVLFPLTRLLVDIGPNCQLKHQTVDYDKYQIISM